MGFTVYRDSITNEEVINSVIDSMQQGINSLESLSKIKKVNDKYKLSLQRKDKGEAIIAKLNKQYSEATTEYKDSLIKAKMCPVCMSAMTEESMRNIEDCI